MEKDFRILSIFVWKNSRNLLARAAGSVKVRNLLSFFLCIRVYLLL